MTAPAYPEHDKLQAVSGSYGLRFEFLEWLTGERGLTICEANRGEDARHYPYVPIVEPFENLLAEFYGIDLAVIEAERRTLDWHQAREAKAKAK